MVLTLALLFLQTQLMHPGGGIYSNLEETYDSSAHFAHRQLRIKKYDLYRWRLGKNLGKISKSNATIDDLRIIDGYLQAYERWGTTKYLKRAKASARGLRRYAFRNGIMSNAVWWNNDEIGTDDTFATETKQLVRSFQIQQKGSTYYGSFVWSEGDTVYSFVQLTAMRALAR